MDYQVSARKWRPQTFEEVIGQKHVTTSLTNAIRLEKIAQAYLFSGIRGVGKTSLARILAKGVNCRKEGVSVPCNTCEPCKEITEGHSVDVIEIDGASNTGVDDVRELRENVKYLPLRGKYKVYIIDEVHMLSNAAFNALLKTLEEPPPHLIFILATTESHKIPGTILSRCQHYAFRRMTPPEIVSQLRQVVDEKKTRITKRGLNLIARAAEGSMRDALSLIDQAISFGGASVTDDDLFMLLGRMDSITFQQLIQAIHQKDAEAALSVARDITDQGCDLRQFLTDWLEHLRNLIVAQNVSNLATWIDLSEEEIKTLQSQAALFSPEAMQRLFAIFSRLLSDIRNTPQPGLLFEVTLMKSMLLADTEPIEAMIEKLDALSSNSAPLNTRVTETSNNEVKKPGAASTPAPLSKVSPNPAANSASMSRSSEANRNPALRRDEAGWKMLLDQIREERPNIGSYLSEGSLDDFGPQEIRIAFSKNSAFLIPLLQKPDALNWLHAFLKNQLGTAIQLVFVENEKEKKVEIKPEKPTKPQAQNDTLPSETKHPLIQEALKIMGGSIIETKRVLGDSKLTEENNPDSSEEKL